MTNIVMTYRVRKPLDIGDSKRMPGELAPEAPTWPLLDSHIHCGNIVQAAVDYDEYVKAIRKYCPELADELGVVAEKRSPKVVPTKEGV